MPPAPPSAPPDPGDPAPDPTGRGPTSAPRGGPPPPGPPPGNRHVPPPARRHEAALGPLRAPLSSASLLPAGRAVVVVSMSFPQWRNLMIRPLRGCTGRLLFG